ncbi:MAG: 50S ribosomal protein L9 [Solobacterium sp.]|nr:50S ribosomal protein L9 [Solobacterium sp.]MBQ1320645.1 50S ribosomal protein L9 [Solobacterium sp.]MBQ1354946.1 50S ribosomal protein L9 [Solobacterium sp.]
MKVILKSDVKKVGRKGEVVEVADGYARNFLIARGLAVATTAKSLEILAEQKEQEHEEEMKRKAEAEALAEKLTGMKFQFLVNANDDGRVFGSVSTKQIVEELAKQGIRIDKRKILDTDPIVSLGVTKVRVELYKGVIGIVNCVLKGK